MVMSRTHRRATSAARDDGARGLQVLLDVCQRSPVPCRVSEARVSAFCRARVTWSSGRHFLARAPPRTMTALLVSALALAGAASVVADDSSSSSSSPALGLAGPSWSSSSSSSWRAVNLADPNAWLESLRARAETIAESRASVSDIYRPLFLASPEGGGEGEGGDRDRGRGRDLGRFDVGPAPGAAGGVAPLLDPDDPIIGRLTLDALELADEIAVTTAPDAALAAKDAAAVLAEQADLAFASLQDAKDDLLLLLLLRLRRGVRRGASHRRHRRAHRRGRGDVPVRLRRRLRRRRLRFLGGRRCCGVRARDLRGGAYAAAFDAEERATHAALARDAAATMIEKTLSTQAKAPVGTYFAPEERVADASRWLDELRATRAEEYRAAAAAAAGGGAATATQSAREGAAYAEELREGDAGLRARAAAALEA